ncbi:hypothetical protein HYPSUDRAFT_909224 [Hypholoma sublateritium FD-334 SS-4]|uniref:Uncharacterized protein n=1 Tax=Hypholoma sublateritium (strain FD-334 SS-4) TaxID=945553 RepID=A0A0D2M710_HYPSF|nr:hypothetical protein HYPSUDRAFT_909224 [Hypholoma sublateritium FD-334 SS-4]
MKNNSLCTKFIVLPLVFALALVYLLSRIIVAHQSGSKLIPQLTLSRFQFPVG